MNSTPSKIKLKNQFLALAVTEVILLAIALNFEIFEFWNEGTYASKIRLLPIFLIAVVGYKLIECGCRILKKHNQKKNQ